MRRAANNFWFYNRSTSNQLIIYPYKSENCPRFITCSIQIFGFQLITFVVLHLSGPFISDILSDTGQSLVGMSRWSTVICSSLSSSCLCTYDSRVIKTRQNWPKRAMSSWQRFLFMNLSQGLKNKKKKIEFQLVLWSSSSHLFLARGYFSLVLVNPLSPKSDQYQISPCNINAL